MTRKEYEAYLARFESFMEQNDISSFSAQGEPFFSASPCEVCGSKLGGNRYQCNAIQSETGDIITFNACVDCVYFVDMGQLDDMTMLSTEESE